MLGDKAAIEKDIVIPASEGDVVAAEFVSISSFIVACMSIVYMADSYHSDWATASTGQLTQYSIADDGFSATKHIAIDSARGNV